MANRGDILIALGTDRHLRAQLAARAATERALQVMRQYPDWAARLKGPTNSAGALEDATWTVSVSRFNDQDASGLFWDIQGVGRSGSLVHTSHLVVEEVGLSKGLPTSGIPLVFAYTTTQELAMMDQGLKWTALGTPPQPGAWLAARGGPLFTFAPDGADASPPPTLEDWQFTRHPAGFLVPSQKTTLTTGVQASRHLVTLQREAAKLTWLRLADPGPGLGRSLVATVDGTADGTPHEATVSGSNGTFTFTDSKFQGPVLEWYWITGKALAARGRTVLCHARHFLYQGARRQNQYTMGGADGKTVIFHVNETEAKVFNKPAVLSFDLDTSHWDRVMDCMDVSDPLAEPVVYDSPEPDRDTLGVVGSSTYAFSAKTLCHCDPHGLAATSVQAPVSRGIYEVAGELAVHELGDPLPTGIRDVHLGKLRPQDDLSLDLPAVRACAQVEGKGIVDCVASPRMRVDASALGDLASGDSYAAAPYGANCVATLGSQTLTVVRVRRLANVEQTDKNLLESARNLLTPASIDLLGLAVHDGTHWQVLPAGLQWLTAHPPQQTGNVIKVADAEGKEILIAPDHLAAAVYTDSANPPQKRYAIVTRY